MDASRRTLLQAAALSTAVPSFWAFAQDAFPTRPLQFIVPFAAGGGNDVLARMVAPHLATALGQPVVVDNRPGAGGNVGARHVAHAEPDGHTLLLATNTLTINPFLVKSIPFDVTKDFEPVTRIANQPIVLVVNPNVPARTVGELVSYLKANPTSVSYASPGNGTPHHFATELFKQVAGVEMVHVPDRGANPALTDLLGGRVQVMFASIISALPFIRDGKLRALATAEGGRIGALPDLLTIKESGYPTYEATIWTGIMTTGGTPSAIARRVANEVLKIMEKPEFVAQLKKAGFEISARGPDELRNVIRTDLEQWARVAKAAGITPE